MKNQKFKTKREFIQELGLSKSTFYRLLKKKKIRTTPEMLSPKVENDLRIALGFPSLYEPGTNWDTLGHIGTHQN